MKIHIKNMVCSRCKMAVGQLLEKNGIGYSKIDLGEVELLEPLDKTQSEMLNDELREIGFELIDDRKSRTVEKIKNLIVDLVHNKNAELKTNLSHYIADGIGQDYSYLSALFSQQESTTIEQYHIMQKVERVKELLAYDELNLSEIADLLHYSSASHLARQFKKVTGLTPTYFKNIGESRRRSLEDL